VPRGADTADTKAVLMKPLYDEYAVGLWRDVLRLTGDASQAGDVVEETLLPAWQHPDAKWRRVIGSSLTPPRSNPIPACVGPGS
jgi:DNA-directed RNA polymerase specialized sigma24 family protein